MLAILSLPKDSLLSLDARLFVYCHSLDTFSRSSPPIRFKMMMSFLPINAVLVALKILSEVFIPVPIRVASVLC
jgi:hypothetical protein